MTSLDVDAAVATALQTVDRNLVNFADVYPDDATEQGIYPPRRARKGYPPGSHTGWTTGFWPGMLWLAYELTGADKYRAAGEVQVERFADRLTRKIDVDHHDIGFLYSLSCVGAYRLTGSQLAHQTALAAADQLMTRFLEAPGVLQAWGTLDDPEQRGRTIVDSLMNVPLLNWASDQTGDPRFAAAGTRHTEQLLRYFVRPDGSTYHTYYFDPESGEPRFGRTHQGYADESTWSRGQAWAIYGFALSYRHTRDERFLEAAHRVADVFLAHTPTDGIVYWDFAFSEGSQEPKDSSASAIAACGLRDLASDQSPRSVSYQRAAAQIVAALHQTCAPTPGSTANTLLLHGTQNRNTDAGVDEGNLWGDYFYLESLTRLSRPNWTPYW
jgi:unsaturated chondroitin disaccharide hydrolase